MAEESDLEKTEPASPRRLEKAREEGNVARSRELATLVMLGTAVGGCGSRPQSLGSTMSAGTAPTACTSIARPASTLPHAGPDRA